ncbi:MAG TPA: septum formation family protein [Natronosporangium sp.]
MLRHWEDEVIVHKPARRLAMVAPAAFTLLLAGCTLPDGVDGDLTDEWQPLSEPEVFVPEVGVCHAEPYDAEGTLDTYAPVDCAEEHVTETVYVGEFTADRVTPPEPETGPWREAFGECEDGAADYLGADYRYARLWLGVVVPSTEAWDGGARWFRCDVLEYDEVIVPDATRTGSLAGALADESAELRLGCFEVDATETEVERMDPVACDEPHQAEFVGVWLAPEGDYPDGDDEAAADQVHAGCRETVAEYVDVPVDDDLPFRTGTIADWVDEEDWNNGDRGFRCYLWLNGDDINESLRGAGPDALPIR